MLSRHTQHRNVTNSPVTRKLSSRGHVRCGLCHKLVTLTLTKVFILLVLFFKKVLCTYFFFIEKGREREREGEEHPCVVASHVPLHQGPGPQPRRVS